VELSAVATMALLLSFGLRKMALPLLIQKEKFFLTCGTKKALVIQTMVA